MTKELNLFLTPASDAKVSDNSTVSQAPKEGESLFDQMLNSVESKPTAQPKTTESKHSNNNPSLKQEVAHENPSNESSLAVNDKEVSAQKSVEKENTLSSKEQLSQEYQSDNDKPLVVKDQTSASVLLKAEQDVIPKTPIEQHVVSEQVIDTTDNVKFLISEKPSGQVLQEVSKEVTSPLIKDSANKDIVIKQPISNEVDIPLDKETKTSKGDFFDSLLKTISKEGISSGQESETVLKTIIQTTESSVNDEAILTEPNKMVQKESSLELENVMKTSQEPANKQSSQDAKPLSDNSELNTSIAKEKAPLADVSGKMESIEGENLIEEVNPQVKSETTLQSVVPKSAEPVVKDQKNLDVSLQPQTVSSPEVTAIKEEPHIEVKKPTVSDVQSQSVEIKTPPKNEEAALALSKLASLDKPEELAVSKESIEKLNDAPKQQDDSVDQPKKEKTLLDKLLQETQNVIKKESKEVHFTQDEPLSNVNGKMVQKNVDVLATNIYLSSQKESINQAAIVKQATGKSVVSEGKKTSDIEKGAQILDLGFQSSEVSVEPEHYINRVNALDQMTLTKKLAYEQLIKQSQDFLTKNSTTVVSNQNNDAVSSDTAPNVEVSVSPTMAMDIQSRMVLAKQQLGSMMSDVARNMYLNYKPPVTTFRINLVPANLGSISIMMKNEKENALTISLNMSNSATLEAFSDNQSILRAALTRNFESSTEFKLDFGMQNDQQNSQGQHNQDHTSSKTNRVIEETLLVSNPQEDMSLNTSSNYM